MQLKYNMLLWRQNLDKIIKGLFRKNNPEIEKGIKSTESNADQMVETPEEVNTEPMVINPPQLLVGSAQSVGKMRDHNEDSLFTLSSVFADGDTQIPFGIFIIADGMGGHQHGEIASRSASKAAADYLVSKLFSPIMGLQNESSGESIVEILNAAVQRAQDIVVRKAPGGGTTLTISVVIGTQVFVAHVGDSRLYLIQKDGSLEQKTKDQSLVSRLVEQGHLSKEEAETHPQRNVLYRAIGQQEPFDPDIEVFQFPENAYMMMCTDGLWGSISPEEISKNVSSSQDLTSACHLMTEAANLAGGPDNISVILVKLIVKG
jgi:PPM family protein phosphatase